MRLEETIQEMYDKYPILFQNRSDCLDHLFCVIGNGYEWNDGELISCDRKKYKYNSYEDEYEFDYIDNTPVKLKGDNKAKQTIYSEEYFKLNEKYKFKWYPICEYSKVINYPSNIKEDWLNGINEVKEMLIKDGIKIENNF